MGLTTVESELRALIARHDADVVVITETRRNRNNCNSQRMKAIFEDYTLFHSCNAPKKTPYHKNAREHLGRDGSGGVTLAIKNVWCEGGSACLISASNKEAFLTSDCVKVRLQPPHSDPLLIWGIYMVFVHSHRREIQTHLMDAMKNSPHSILARDWNAGLFDIDRPDEYDDETENIQRAGTDCVHTECIMAVNLKAIDEPGQDDDERRRSFRSNRADAQGSRIDDVLISRDLSTRQDLLEFPDSSGDSDHNPILATLYLNDLTMIMPPSPLPERTMPPRIKTPINPDDLAKFKTQVSLELGQHIASIQTQVTELINEAETTLRRDRPIYTKDTPSSTILHSLAPQKRVLEEEIKKLLLEAVMPIAETTLEMSKPVVRKHIFHRPQASQRQYIRAAKMARWLRKAACTFDDAVESRDRANATKGIDAVLVQHSDFNSDRMPFPPACSVLSEGRISQAWLAWREKVKKEAVIARAIHNMIRVDKAKHQKAKYRTFIQRLFAKKQKAANKIIKGASTNNKITALKDTEGNVHFDPEKVSKIVEEYFQESAKPRVDLNIGERTPDCDPLPCPWEQKIDPFKLQTRVHTESNEQVSLAYWSYSKTSVDSWTDSGSWRETKHLVKTEYRMRSSRICQTTFLTQSTNYLCSDISQDKHLQIANKSHSPALQERQPNWHKELSTNCTGQHND